MAGKEKLVKKFLTDRMHITVEDCDRLLTDFGYNLHKKGGSPIIVVTPKNTKYVKPGYVAMLIKRLNLEAQNDD